MNAGCLINDVKFAKADSVTMSVENILIFNRFKVHVRALLALVTASMKRKVRVMDAMAMVIYLLQSGRSTTKSDCSLKISKLMRELQQQDGLIKSTNWEVQEMHGLITKASRSREEHSKLK